MKANYMEICQIQNLSKYARIQALQLSSVPKIMTF